MKKLPATTSPLIQGVEAKPLIHLEYGGDLFVSDGINTFFRTLTKEELMVLKDRVEFVIKSYDLSDKCDTSKMVIAVNSDD